MTEPNPMSSIMLNKSGWRVWKARYESLFMERASMTLNKIILLFFHIPPIPEQSVPNVVQMTLRVHADSPMDGGFNIVVIMGLYNRACLKRVMPIISTTKDNALWITPVPRSVMFHTGLVSTVMEHVN